MMNWLPWILVVAMGYEVQCQAYSDRTNRGDGQRDPSYEVSIMTLLPQDTSADHPRRKSRRYIPGQSFPSSDGCNTCTCSGHNRVACTEKACLPNPPESFPSLFCFVNNRIYMMGQSFPSGCNTCTCRSNNQVLCTLIACPEESPCKVGQPLPGAACGGLRDLPCPDPDKYECVGRPVPGLFDGPGVCCLEPDLCQLPSVTGPCRASFPRWYYDYNEKKCKQFIYGGCGGNANRFETEAECQQRCGEDVCQLPSEVGPCDGVCPSWYYNYGEKKCKEFNYGCCGGNANRFETKTKCQQRCGEEQPQCKIGNPLEGVSCGGFRPTGPLPCPDGYECVGEALAYDGPGVCCLKSDPAQPQCKIGNPLEGVSCGGRPPIPCPDSRYVCVGEALLFDGPGVCCLKSAQDLCQLPSVTGRCKAFIPSWYYDYKEKKCKQFIYGGCGGNGNRFKTQAECQKKCGEEPVCKGRKQLPKRTCGGLMGKPCPRNYECVGQLVPVDGLGVCCRKGQAQTDPLCPRLNPNLHARCRLEHCPRRGCPGRQKCCPSHCGTTCRALRGPCGINPPLADSSGTQLFCGRGRNRVDCPQDHYCAIHPTDRYAVCCRYV